MQNFVPAAQQHRVLWRGHIFSNARDIKISLLQTHRAACRPSRHLEPRHLTSRRQTGHPKTLPLHLPLPRPLEAHRRARHERITFNRHAWVPRQSEPADIGLAPADLTPVGNGQSTAHYGSNWYRWPLPGRRQMESSRRHRKYVRKANCPPPPPTSRRPQSLSAQETRYGADPSLGKFWLV